MRYVSLVENGTHVLFSTQLGSYRTAEATLARAAPAARPCCAGPSGRADPGLVAPGAHIQRRLRKKISISTMVAAIDDMMMANELRLPSCPALGRAMFIP